MHNFVDNVHLYNLHIHAKVLVHDKLENTFRSKASYLSSI